MPIPTSWARPATVVLHARRTLGGAHDACTDGARPASEIYDEDTQTLIHVTFAPVPCYGARMLRILIAALLVLIDVPAMAHPHVWECDDKRYWLRADWQTHRDNTPRLGLYTNDMILATPSQPPEARGHGKAVQVASRERTKR